jgi:hypothetical protein
MEKNNKPVDVTQDPNDHVKNKKDKHPKSTGIGTGILLIILGLAALYGWWKLEPIFFRVPLYIVATLLIGFAIFGIIEEFTLKAKTNCSLAGLFLTWAISLLYSYSVIHISALRWLFLIFAGFFGVIALIAFAVQANKDIRSRPILGLITAIVVIPSLYIVLGWLFAQPVILLFIPFTFVLLYNEYLSTAFLRAPVTKTQRGEVLHESKTDITAPYRSLGETLNPRGALRNLWGIRPFLYGILIFFSILFYFIVTQVSAEKHYFSLFYEAVAAAYLGILAIVIAFAVLVIRRETLQEVTEDFRRAVTGLVQMYVIFALITVVGLILGTEVSGDILTRSMELSEILESVDSLLNVCRLLTLEFAVLAFPVGLLYLYAMIKDFMRS